MKKGIGPVVQEVGDQDVGPPWQLCARILVAGRLR